MSYSPVRRSGADSGSVGGELMPTSNNCPVSTKGLDLKPYPEGQALNWIDQHGRVLRVYTNKQGKLDLNPVGVGVRR